jgi:biotin synthase
MLRLGYTRLRINIAHRTLATHASSGAVAPSSASTTTSATRHDWTRGEIQAIYDTPLLELVFRAAGVHRQHHDPRKIQLCTLMNIKSMLPPRPFR